MVGTVGAAPTASVVSARCSSVELGTCKKLPERSCGHVPGHGLDKRALTRWLDCALRPDKPCKSQDPPPTNVVGPDSTPAQNLRVQDLSSSCENSHPASL